MDINNIDNRFNEAWDRALSEANFESGTNAYETFEQMVAPERQAIRRKVLRRVATAAASVVIIFTAALLTFNLTEMGSVEYAEFVGGEDGDSIRLEDNTIVWLNANSRLIYPTKFGRKSRNLFLTGEGYFDVAHDKSRPFKLSVGEIEVRVLGTEFNVEAYDNMSDISVSLIEGSVECTSKADPINNKVCLTKGEVAKFNRREQNLAVSHISREPSYVWRNGGVKFNDASLGSIAERLEDIFDVEIDLNESLQSRHYAVAFVNNETLDDMLQQLNIDQSMSIKRIENNIIITPK